MAFAISAGAAAVIGAGGAIGGAIIGGNAANSAAQKQADSARYAADLQKQEYDQTRADQQPWRDAGSKALSQLQDPSLMRSFGASDFQQDPGYQFRMDEGQKALERSAAARGGLQSGAFDKALTQYGQNFASNEYQNAYNRFTNDQTNRFNRLSSIAGVGQTANAQVGAAGQNYANNVGGLMTGAANAQGAAQIAGANAMSSSLGNIGKMGMDMYALNRLAPQTQAPQAPAAAPAPMAPMATADYGSFAYT